MAKPLDTPHVDETTKRVTLIVSTISCFMGPFMVSSITVALPAIAREFRMDAILLTWVPMSYILSGAIFLMPLGKLADIYGRKKLLAWGIAIFTMASVLCGLAASGEMLIFFRVIQGIGGSVIFGTSVAILMSVFSVGERGRVLGLAVGAVYVGLALGPFVGGFLTQQFGWRSIFLWSGPLGAALLVAILWKLKGEWAEAKGERLDMVGSAIYSVALVATLYGLTALPALTGTLCLAGGLIGLFIFGRWEMRVKNPVLDLTLFSHNRVFTLSILAMFINYGATYAIGFLMSLYLQYIKHLTPQNAGLIMIAQPVVQAAFSPYAGKLSDRMEPQIVASCGMGLSIIGLTIFAFLNDHTPLWFVMATLALHGLAFALFSAPNTNAVMGAVEKKFYGVASGVASTMRLMGNVFSVTTVMFIFSLYIGRSQITPALYPAFLASTKTIFVIFAFLCLGGLFASLSRGKIH